VGYGQVSYAERLARLVYVAAWLVLAAVIFVVARGFGTGHWPLASALDPQTGTAEIDVATDAGTGCQYILTPWGGITPRMGADGRQVCARKP
jgi:hypothetical protein